MPVPSPPQRRSEVSSTKHGPRCTEQVLLAVVRLRLERSWNARTRILGEPRLRGDVTEILVSDIHVPRSLRSPLDALVSRDERARTMQRPGSGVGTDEPRLPRYEATLSYGHRLEPWLTGVRPLAERP